jgi:Transposase DDE domain
MLAMRRTEHGSGLGRWRWVVERTFACLSQFRRLPVRYEKRADVHEAFLSLGCALICWQPLRRTWRIRSERRRQANSHEHADRYGDRPAITVVLNWPALLKK